jgi:hypothetical protein
MLSNIVYYVIKYCVLKVVFVVFVMFCIDDNPLFGFFKVSILINEGTTSQISLKNSSQQDCNFEHIIVKWNSSSTPELHNLPAVCEWAC